MDLKLALRFDSTLVCLKTINMRASSNADVGDLAVCKLWYPEINACVRVVRNDSWPTLTASTASTASTATLSAGGVMGFGPVFYVNMTKFS